MRECANNGLVFDEERKKMTVDYANCVGCGRCIGACNFDAIDFAQDAAVKELNCRMAEYTKAVVDGRPAFHISLICDVSPTCDCHSGNDTPIIPDVGMFASSDPLALDQACVTNPNTEYRTCLAHAEKIGLGSREYELVEVR